MANRNLKSKAARSGNSTASTKGATIATRRKGAQPKKKQSRYDTTVKKDNRNFGY